MWNIAVRFDLGLKVAYLVILPVEDIATHHVPRHSVAESDRFGDGE